MMEHGEGHICTISSAAGIVGAPKMVDYCASKVLLFFLSSFFPPNLEIKNEIYK